jgi:hypothetical protein
LAECPGGRQVWNNAESPTNPQLAAPPFPPPLKQNITRRRWSWENVWKEKNGGKVEANCGGTEYPTQTGQMAAHIPSNFRVGPAAPSKTYISLGHAEQEIYLSNKPAGNWYTYITHSQLTKSDCNKSFWFISSFPQGYVKFPLIFWVQIESKVWN